MAKMKGLFKGMKYISQIFVVKEHEMEIGYPTDVRHVAHIGWDSGSTNAPSWMNEFRTASDLASPALGLSRETSWASQDFDQPRGLQQQPSGMFADGPRPEIPKAPKKTKRKKSKSSSPNSSTRSTSRTSRSRAGYSSISMGDSNETVNR
ncbi:CRIB domain-containing protein RIC10-like [Dioscorea cayenensis subsp. rotundata]|uniref:CRIB domain-containing protein RIC10-like n=1 Tax=Dioscorea cayennensis subsp. rotundata TaxID=55577 RepID=A0AB40BX41_DIOCR|nr:CRIB domain-containing protein RIC10-like [Dioscorea cayenensis subsp. rotundata]